MLTGLTLQAALAALIAGFDTGSIKIHAVGVAGAIAAAPAAQLILAPGAVTGEIVGWAALFIVTITAVSLVVERYRSPALQKHVSWVIAPILIIVGVRFLPVAMSR